MKNIEQELKAVLDERQYGILLEKSNVQPVLQTNYYFRYDKMPQSVMVRIRERNGEYILCYKCRISQNGGVTVCDERECEIGDGYAKKLISRGVTGTELNQMLNCGLSSDFVCVGKLDTYRTKFTLGNWKLELDKNEYLGTTDYELECEDNDIESLNRLKNYLYYTFGISFKPSLPKSERFFEKYDK